MLLLPLSFVISGAVDHPDAHAEQPAQVPREPAQNAPPTPDLNRFANRPDFPNLRFPGRGLGDKSFLERRRALIERQKHIERRLWEKKTRQINFSIVSVDFFVTIFFSFH
jgi:hypothetical protein